VDWLKQSDWLKRHQGHADEAAKGEAEIVFFGDSITEGLPQSQAFKRTFSGRKAAAFGISGDRTPHLLWRIENGACGKLQPKMAFLLIGVNNFGHLDQSPEEVARGIKAVAKALTQRLPEAKLVILGIFPAGQSPTDPLRAKIRAANALISAFAGECKADFLDIGGRFLNSDESIPSSLMPDFLHPNEEGYQVWMDSIGHLLD
jgi:lysophospholipase L1-like esterase